LEDRAMLMKLAFVVLIGIGAGVATMVVAKKENEPKDVLLLAFWICIFVAFAVMEALDALIAIIVVLGGALKALIPVAIGMLIAWCVGWVAQRSRIMQWLADWIEKRLSKLGVWT